MRNAKKLSIVRFGLGYKYIAQIFYLFVLAKGNRILFYLIKMFCLTIICLLIIFSDSILTNS